MNMEQDNKLVKPLKKVLTIASLGMMTAFGFSISAEANSGTAMLANNNSNTTTKESLRKAAAPIGPLMEYTQQKQSMVHGKVMDANNQPLPGATLLVKGSTRGVTTDIDGSFEIEVSPEDVLIVQFLGMQDQEVKVGNQKTIVVILKEQTDELDEVTVVAYGKQKKASVIGAISTITADEVQVPVAKLSTALAGQMAGIVSIQRNAEPGSGADFWIRGISTFGANNTPLILVDGIERSLDLVDPEDIASLSILKDATATALYGVRGANGIVLITTKRGKEAKPSINAKVEYGFITPTRTPQLASASQWMDYYNDITLEGNGNLAYQPNQYAKYLNGTDPDLYPNVDWWDTIFKNSSNNVRANINVSGGSRNIRYYIAGSFYSENGVFNPADNPQYTPQVGYKKANFRANVDVDITKTTKLALSVSNQYETKNRLGVAVESYYDNLISVPSVAVVPIFSDGSLSRPLVGTNPYLELNHTGYSADFWNNAQSLISIDQDFGFITEGLKGNVKFSYDARNERTTDKRKSPSTYLALGRDKEGNLILNKNNDGNDYLSIARSNRGSQVWNFETSLTYERLFNDEHRVSGLFLFNMREYTDNFAGNYIASFPNRNIGIAGRAAYSFRDKYFAEFNFGYNGSENFAPGHRFGFFPSGALGYMISNEEFWEPIADVISLLKFKGSYGQIGNDEIGGNRRFAYNTEMNASAAGYNFGDPVAWIQGIATGNPGNPNVTWETAKKTDVGFELGLFNKFRLVADYFMEKRDGIFISQESIPSVVGINVTQYVNLGRMQNQGVDMSLEYSDQVTEDFFISARGNFTFNRNKVLYDDKPSQMYPYLNDVGFPSGQHKGLISMGLFESQEDIDNWPTQTFGTVRVGDIKYKDIDGNGIVDSNDRVPFGRTTIPEINYGFGVSMKWRNWDLSIFFQGSGNVGRMISGAMIRGTASNITSYGNLYEEVAANRWTEWNPDPNAKYPRMHISGFENNNQGSDFWYRNVSYLRLKNAEIGYSLPKALISKIGLSTLRFYAQGVNLLTFSPFKMWDPELNTGTGGLYPQTRTVAIGMNLNF